MPLPFPMVGHGPPKVADDLYVWLVADASPEAAAAERACAALPPDLAEWIRPDDTGNGGTLTWHGPVLHLYSGYGIGYYAQTLEDGYLAWLSPDVPPTPADVERILEEVLDETLTGARAPKELAWQRFGAELAEWSKRVHAEVPLSLVVVGRKVKLPGTRVHTASVVWATSHLEDLQARSRALREVFGTHYGALGWTQPLAAAVLAATTAKSLSEAQRWALLMALDGTGLAADVEATKLLNGWPKRERPAVLARLLREGHDLGLLLLAGKTTHPLLLEDVVAEASLATSRGLLLPYVVEQAYQRCRKPGKRHEEWLARFIAAGERFAEGLGDDVQTWDVIRKP